MNQETTSMSVGYVRPTDLETELNSFQQPKLTDAVVLPKEVYENLPPYLASACSIFQNKFH